MDAITLRSLAAVLVLTALAYLIFILGLELRVPLTWR